MRVELELEPQVPRLIPSFSPILVTAYVVPPSGLRVKLVGPFQDLLVH